MEKDSFPVRLSQKLKLDCFIQLSPSASLTWYNFCSQAENHIRLKRGKYPFEQQVWNLCIPLSAINLSQLSILLGFFSFDTLNEWLTWLCCIDFVFLPCSCSQRISRFFWGCSLCDLKSGNPVNNLNIWGGLLFSSPSRFCLNEGH